MADPHAITGSERERGAALMTVLLLVAVMAVVTATALERLTLATRLAGNGAALDQARAYARTAEEVATLRIADLVAADPAKTTLAGGWLGAPQRMVLGAGTVTARVFDGGNCFNLNSLVDGEDPEKLATRPAARSQFAGLMRALEVDAGRAEQVAAAAADWIDSDSVPQPGGAEDEAYLKTAIPYRTANTLMADPSELRAVAGVTPELYARLAPWLCTLPVTDLSPINVNTLLPDQAPLYAMLFPDDALSIAQARALLARRPAGGYGDVSQFWNLTTATGISHMAEAGQQVGLATRWFRVGISVELGGMEMQETALIDAKARPARLVARQWGDIGVGAPVPPVGEDSDG